MGRLDGLPAAVRDEANRIVFDQKYAQYRLELASVPKPPANEWTWITAGRFPSKVHTDEWMDWHRQYGERYEHLTRSLKGMDSIQKRFDRTETGPGACPRRISWGSARRATAGRSSPTETRTLPTTRRCTCRGRRRT